MVDITHIHFTELQKLSLYGNDIESVEGLSTMFMPVLEMLAISNSTCT